MERYTSPEKINTDLVNVAVCGEIEIQPYSANWKTIATNIDVITVQISATPDRHVPPSN